MALSPSSRRALRELEGVGEIYQVHRRVEANDLMRGQQSHQEAPHIILVHHYYMFSIGTGNNPAKRLHRQVVYNNLRRQRGPALARGPEALLPAVPAAARDSVAGLRLDDRVISHCHSFCNVPIASLHVCKRD